MLQMNLGSLILATAVPGESGMAILGAVIACGMVVIGAGLSIAYIGGKALESIARQPEAGGRLFLAMVIAGALVEGIALFSLLICFLVVNWLH
jgi:F-type H+-transporting ATPase subunit c